MKKFFLKISIYAFVLFIILNTVSFLVLKRLNNVQFYKPQFVKNAAIENSFDYVVLGSSVGLTTLNTKQIDATLGTNGLNISMDDTSLNTHLLMLKHFYKCNRKTKKLILCITPWDIVKSKYNLNNNDYRFLPNVEQDYVSDYYYNLEEGLIKKLYLSKYVPMIGVCYYNYEMVFPAILTIFKDNKHNKFDDRGNFSYPETNGIKARKNIILQDEKVISSYFFKIYNFCKNNNIELIVYQSPIYGKKMEYSNFPLGIKFINHSNLVTGKMFYDDIHVNAMGRSFCTAEFCKELTN